jgi:hypothetical protein
MSKQTLNNINMTSPRSPMQSRQSTRRSPTQRTPPLNKQPNNLQTPIISSLMQRRPPVRAVHIWISARIKEKSRQREILVAYAGVQRCDSRRSGIRLRAEFQEQ